MKTQIYLIAMGFVANLIIANAQDTDFRNTTWGMTLRNVKETEKAQTVLENKNKLFYKTEVAGSKCTLSYIFNEDGELYGSRYIYIEEHEDISLYIDDYYKIQSLLKRKYGTPSRDEVICESEKCKKDRNLWVLALRNNELSLISQWQTDKTVITVKLIKGTKNMVILIDYESIAVTRQMKEAFIQKALKDL